MLFKHVLAHGLQKIPGIVITRHLQIVKIEFYEDIGLLIRITMKIDLHINFT